MKALTLLRVALTSTSSATAASKAPARVARAAVCVRHQTSSPSPMRLLLGASAAIAPNTPHHSAPVAADSPAFHNSGGADAAWPAMPARMLDRKSTRLNSSHSQISYAVFCLKKKKQ